MVEIKIPAYLVPILARYKRVYACSCTFSREELPSLPPRKVEIRTTGTSFIPLETFNVEELMRRHGVSRRTAFRWKKQGARPGFLYKKEMPSKINYRKIARLSAWRVGKNLYDRDALEEFEQEALWAMWRYSENIDFADDPDAYAFKVAIQAARVSYRKWRYDRLGITKIPEENKRDIVNRSVSYLEDPHDEEMEEE